MAIAGIGVTHEHGFRKYHRTTLENQTLLMVLSAGRNQTEIQEPISEEIFAARQEFPG